MKWWTKAKSGKIYYYFRYQHSSGSFHFLSTDSTYSSSPILKNKAMDLYLMLEDFIAGKMDKTKFTYTTFIKELAKTYKMSISNGEFNRALKKAISKGLVRKEGQGGKILYAKIPSAELTSGINFERMVIGYGFESKRVNVTVFLQVINNTDTLLKKLSYYIPVGLLTSLNDLNIRGHDELGQLPSSGFKTLISTNTHTIISIALNRMLRKNEREYVFLSYQIPKVDEFISFVTSVKIDFMRITATSTEQQNFVVERVLSDGARKTTLQFRKKCLSSFGDNCMAVELDVITIGENISIKMEPI
ncbi:MAG: hypothetical protein M1290_05210 [Candidatus Thermoplasmatota archaeon]|nr:hypothetical protein [Candidatus Thermoplasmatota archaeon]MCL5789843.1 hypothetical protein [Candidatus Thermoplasmatota archaeon]